MIVTILPVRGGSKRIKNKNIINICYKFWAPPLKEAFK